MGRYDDQYYLTITPEYIPMLFKNDILIGRNKVRMVGSYEEFELRINLIPYNSVGDILLHKAGRRENGVIYHTVKIPQRIVTLPSYVTTGGYIGQNILIETMYHNAYLSIANDTIDDTTGIVTFDNLSLFALMNRTGLRFKGDSPKVTFNVVENEKIMYGSSHCVDIYAFVEVDYATIESEFIYIPDMLFEQYCRSRAPETYAEMYGFRQDEYDETSEDFRMNPEGKQQILTAFKTMKANHLV